MTMLLKTAILHYAAPPVVGGVEAVILAHARQMVKAGWQVSVIAGAGNTSAFPAGCEFIPVPEMDTRYPEILKFSSVLETGAVPSEFEPLKDRLMERLQPILSSYDRIIVHNIFTKHFNLPLTAALHQLTKTGKTRGMVAWCHDLSWSSPTSRSKVFDGYPWDLLRTSLPGVTYVAVSRQRQQETAETFGLPLDQVQVIYNGVDPVLVQGISSDTYSLAERLGLTDADLILLMPVRVTRAKNIEYAMRVLAALKKSGVQPRLVVTGPPDPHDAAGGGYFEELRTLRQKMNLERELRFVYESGPNSGEPYQVDERTVYELLRLSDVMFMPSHHEGFGMPVLEAGLAGVPVMTTDVPAAAEIARSQVYVFSLNTPPDVLASQLAARLEEIKQSQLRRRLRKEFTWDAIFDRQIRPLLEGL